MIRLRTIAPVGAILLALEGVAGSVRAYTSTRWIGEPVPVPIGARGGEVTADFTDDGGRDVQLYLRLYDADGKTVGDCSALPAQPPLADACLGRRWSFTASVEGDRLRSGAVTARPIAVVGERTASGRPFALHGLSVRWRTAPESDRLANWIALGETISFRGVLPDGAVGLQATVTDSAGLVVSESRESGKVWRWTPDRPGFYEVAFDWLDATNGATRAAASLFANDVRTRKDGARRQHRFKAFARDRQAIVVTPRGPVAPETASPTFGFHLSLLASSDFYRKTQYDLVRLLGMSAFLRLQWIGWYDVERVRGVYDWKAVDAAFRCAEAAGFPSSRQIVGIFGTPVWNTTATDLTFGPFKGPHMYAPKDLAPWRDFVAAVVRRYPQLRTIEIWNEPHLPGYSVFWRDSSPEQFADLMRTAYRAAKDVRPDVTVMMGGIGMRYLPFYERVVSLGIVSSFDMLGTHCGYDMRAFRDCERRHGAPHKPYFENEWHTVLYNCTSPDRPDEDGCSYRMLRNLANLLMDGHEHVTGFGLTCGERTPETADFFAAVGGIQQVCGLFRNKPFLEPRRAALALRTATDRFRGPVRRIGAWCFGEDGAQKAAVFASDAGKVAFVWNENPRRPTWERSLKAAGGRILDWEGRETSWANMRPQAVYFIESPDCDRLASGGHPLDRLDYFANLPKRKTMVEEGAYAVGRAVTSIALTNGTVKASFSASLSPSALSFDVKGAEPLDAVRLALDVEGRGDIDDVVEIVCSRDGRLVKPRTPDLRGDIPPEFTPAGATLTKSEATWSEDGRGVKLVLAMSDLYPFVHSPGKILRVCLSLRANGGSVATWGSGWESVPRNPSAFGRLVPLDGGESRRRGVGL